MASYVKLPAGNKWSDQFYVNSVWPDNDEIWQNRKPNICVTTLLVGKIEVYLVVHPTYVVSGLQPWL